MAKFLHFQPPPGVPASARYALCRSSHLHACSRYRACPLQRGTSLASAPFPSIQPVPSLLASVWYGLYRSSHSKLSPGAKFWRISAARTSPLLPSTLSAGTEPGRISAVRLWRSSHSTFQPELSVFASAWQGLRLISFWDFWFSTAFSANVKNNPTQTAPPRKRKDCG
jgi:hypothetical protein